MTENNIQVVLSRLEDLHQDVRDIRSVQQVQGRDITELKVAVAKQQGKSAVLSFMASAVVPFLVAIFAAGLALAFGR